MENIFSKLLYEHWLSIFYPMLKAHILTEQDITDHTELICSLAQLINPNK